MEHPLHFLVVRECLPLQQTLPILRRSGCTTKLTLLVANYKSRSEVIGYATTIHGPDHSLLVQPVLDLSEKHCGHESIIARGLAGMAIMSAILVDRVDIARVYRAPGLGLPNWPDRYADGLFSDLAPDAIQRLPEVYRALAKLDMTDSGLARVRGPQLQTLDGRAMMAIAKFACEFIEKSALWHVGDPLNEDDVKPVRLFFDTPLSRDPRAMQSLYRMAARPRAYVRKDERTTRFAGR